MTLRSKKSLYSFEIVIFLIISIILFCVFEFAPLSFESQDRYKFVLVFWCFLYSIYNFLLSKNTNKILLCLALFFTCFADFFLLILGENTVGVFVFIFAQGFHFAFINMNNETDKRKLIIFLTVYAFVVTTLLVGLGVVKEFYLQNVFVAFYFPMLVLNFALSFLLIRNNKYFVIYSIGLLLFIGCDVCVGLFNMFSWQTAFTWMWIFYPFSQILIALSSLPLDLKEIFYE